MFVSVESSDKFDNNTLAVDCADEEFRSIEASVTLPSIAQNNSKRTAENSATNKRMEGSRSMARDREEIRSEEGVQHKFGICSIDQKYL